VAPAAEKSTDPGAAAFSGIEGETTTSSVLGGGKPAIGVPNTSAKKAACG